MPTAYYNEIDPFAAAWLRELIKAGHIAPGEVDERSIEDVKPGDLRGYKQCHFFAGIGVWSYALRQAGWSDDREVWTGSCPCQPFSTAGKRTGTADERHLWPGFFSLIEQLRPPTIFGEQVGSKDGIAWLDTVSSDMEGTGYTFGAADTCAAGFGAPHIRQRLYFVGSLGNSESEIRKIPVCGWGSQQDCFESGGASRPSPLYFVADSQRQQKYEEQQRPTEDETERGADGPGGCRVAVPSSRYGELGNPDNSGLPQRECDGRIQREALESPQGQASFSPSLTNGFWRDSDWIACRDGKYRPVEPGSFPLAHGSPNRVGRLRGYGNAVVAPVATAFIEAFLETERGS